jgi:winged helix DNA-binding protein
MRAPADPLEVLRSWAVQDSPPGAAIAAIVARCADVPVGWLERAIYERRAVVALYNPRTATAIVPADEAAAYGTAFLPDDDAGLKAIVGPALPEHSEGFAEPVALAVEAVSDALDGVTLSRDALHEELRHRLPAELLPWCPGCESHHARRGLLVMAALHGRLCIADRAGRQPAFARTDQLVGWDAPPRRDAGAELVRRYRREYGPSTPAHFAEWAGLGKAHARELWALAGDEPPARWAPAGDERPERSAAEGVRLLAPGDPVLLGRDREALLTDPALRRTVWAAIGGAGIVLSDGAPVAIWRARKQGKRLEVTVDAFGDVPAALLEAELQRLAPHRGCTSVTILATGSGH